MQRHPMELTSKIKKLRSAGKTYGEINKELNIKLAKSTLHWICKNVDLPSDYKKRIEKLNFENIGKAKAISLEMIRIKREEFFAQINFSNGPISEGIKDKNSAKIALSMLCLGEAAKSTSKSSFSLGNSDPRIIVLFLGLIDFCFGLEIEKVRCTVQCRADQNTDDLEDYWHEETGIPKRLFYKSRIDPRTVGKPTVKKDYKGVLKVDYFNRKVQYDLESLAQLVYNQVYINWARSISANTLEWHS